LYKIPANTVFLGKNLVFVPECHSTNTLALQLSQNPSSPEGSVVITNNQTAGRGQRGNTWETAPGMNLTFSTLLKPRFLPIKDHFYLNLITSLAVHDFLSQKSTEPIHIKWPNDILVHGKKICGILIENQVQGTVITSSVVGIGFNVNQTQFPSGTPTSLRLITSTVSDLQEILDGLLGCLEARYLHLRQDSSKVTVKRDYLDRLYWRNETHQFSSADTVFNGRITSVDETGRLAVETNEGVRYFGIKEITYLN
jgi:BirA family biotin operon repressor/biotin-[acetyl-CoA-carboxylase] ligase